MKKKQANPERSFGLSVGGVLCLLALLMAWRGRLNVTAIAGTVGAALVFAALTMPRVLAHPSRWWWRLVHMLGYVNSRVVLTLFYVGLLVPVSLLFRALGRDPLGERRTTSVGWSRYPERYKDPAHFRRMF